MRFGMKGAFFEAAFFLGLGLFAGGAADTCGLAADVAQRAAKTFQTDIAKGIKLFIKARELCAEDPSYDYNLGVAYFQYGIFDTAEKHLKAAVEKRGDNALWLNNLTEALLYSGNPSEGALKDINRATRKFGSDQAVLSARGRILESYLSLIKEGAVNEGLAGLKKADSDPKILKAYLLSLAGTGKTREALKEASLAKNRFPADDEISQVFDSVMEKTILELYSGFRLGRSAEAVQSAKVLSEAYPENRDAKKAYDELFEAFMADAASIPDPEPARKHAAAQKGKERSDELLASIYGDSKKNQFT